MCDLKGYRFLSENDIEITYIVRKSACVSLGRNNNLRSGKRCTYRAGRGVGGWGTLFLHSEQVLFNFI